MADDSSGKSIAIVLYASEYKNLHNLPACVSDAKGAFAALDALNVFDDIYLIDGNHGSRESKDFLATTISDCRSSPVSTVAFYYSGHGLIRDEEFRYTFGDYDDSRVNKTTLSDIELNDMLKSLEPTICLKMIDACNSGKRLIKSISTDEQTILEKSARSFESCYFMYSSDENTSSFQDSEMSFFTRTILTSMARLPDGPIRFRTLMDEVADTFEPDIAQKPYFISQGYNTEQFYLSTDSIRETIANLFPEAEPVAPLDAVGMSELLKQLAVDKEKGVLTKKITGEELLNVGQIDFELDEELSEIYDLKVAKHEDSDDCPAKLEIGSFLEHSSTTWFARATYKNRSIQRSGIGFLGSEPRVERVMMGYTIHSEVPLSGIKISLRSTYQSVFPYDIQFWFIPSIDRVRVFHFLVRRERYNWDSLTIISGIDLKSFDWDNDDNSSLAEPVSVVFHNYVNEILDATKGLLGAPKEVDNK